MMSDLASLILNCICFYAHSSSDAAKSLANGVIEYAENELRETDVEDPVERLLYRILQSMINEDLDLKNPAEIERLLLQFQRNPAVKQDPDLLPRLERMLDPKAAFSTQRLNHLERQLRTNLVWQHSAKTIRKLSGMYFKGRGKSMDVEDQELILNDIVHYAQELATPWNSNKSDALDEIDMSNRESVRNAIEQHQRRRGVSRIKTGWQGLNELLDGGFIRGELVGIGALSHHYKSGICMDFARWACTLNRPIGAPHDTTPVIVFISLENEIFENYMLWQKAVYAHNDGNLPTPVTEEELQQFCSGQCGDDLKQKVDNMISSVTDHFSRNGIYLHVRREEAGEFSWEDFRALQEELKSRRMYVIAWVIDYMQLMKLPDETKVGLNHAQLMQALFRSARNYANTTGETIITGVQLNASAEQMAEQSYAVKRFTSKCIGDASGIKRELDCLIWQHIEIGADNKKWLTQKIDKRRYHTIPTGKDSYIAYPFTEQGILDDIGQSTPTYVRDIFDLPESVTETVSLF